MLHGTAVSEGIGLGRVMLLEECSLVYREERTNGAQAERERFRQAAEAYRRKTQAQMEHLKRSAGEEDAQILEAHMAMSGDPSLLRRVGERIDQGKSAEAALQEVCGGYIEVFSASSDELTRRRAEDVRELCRANSWGSYGRCWACPPDAGDIRRLIEEAKRGRRAMGPSAGRPCCC